MRFLSTVAHIEVEVGADPETASRVVTEDPSIKGLGNTRQTVSKRVNL